MNFVSMFSVVFVTFVIWNSSCKAEESDDNTSGEVFTRNGQQYRPIEFNYKNYDIRVNADGSPIVQLDCSGKQYFQAEANDQSCIIPFVDFYEYDVENTDDNGKEGGGNEDGNDDETDE